MTEEKNRNRLLTEITALHSAELTGDTVPGRVVLTPWGRVESLKGDFIIDEESAAAVIRAFEEHGTDIPIDYEHQTLGGRFASPDGRAPAAGWIKRLSAEPGVGLVADIEWTAQGRQMLAAREYRYLSPVAVIRKSDRKLTAIHSAALTNKPAIVAMEAIVSSADSAVEPADEEDLLCILRAELQLPGDCDALEILASARRRIAEMKETDRKRRVEERVTTAMRAGKLTAAQRRWAQALIARDEALFEEWLCTAPVVVQVGATAAPHVHDAAHSSKAAANRARAEYRASPLLASLTTEEAYVADSARMVA